MDANEQEFSQKPLREKGKRFLTFRRLLGFSALLCITVAAGLWISRDYSRTNCDRAASADVGKASACLERLGNELVDLDIRFDNDQAGETLVSTNALRYLVGPYYGWRGGTQRCGVLFRFAKVDNKWQLQGAALRGFEPAGQGSRYVYRSPVACEDGKAQILTGIVDARNGKAVDWNAYPYREDPNGPERCYTESIVDQTKTPPPGHSFVLRVPNWVPCDQLR